MGAEMPRLRGGGSGISGSTPKRAVSSCKEGMDVVRALYTEWLAPD